jgi:phytanoyl-CoA hydroxylase
VARNRGEYDVAFNHARYNDLIKRAIEDQGFECRAPALSKGDVLFFNAKTIHGSLESPDPQYSRRSSPPITSRSHTGSYSTKARSNL